MNLTKTNNRSAASRRSLSLRSRNYFYIVSVGCLNCGVLRMLTEIALHNRNLNGRTMRGANLVVDAGLIDSVNRMPPCPTCHKTSLYDPARTELRLHRNA